MADDKKKSTEDDESASHAADEPTAVWDANSLREAGLGDLINKPDSDPPPAAIPVRKGNDGPSIVVDDVAAGAKSQHVQNPAATAGGELGWLTTIALAAALGGVVYVLIRVLR